MTAAPVLMEVPDEIDWSHADDEADWPIIWRLMNWWPVGDRPATVDEYRLAAWLLLDLGFAPVDIEDRTGLTRAQVVGVVNLRNLASEPDRPRGPRGGRNPADARKLAPTAELRSLLAVPRGVTRPLR